ncbi:hypothetical protein GH733_002882 [Mirounga leonina]|nr:hypothetical protein GH733_002882 [Mirounga leonina]
MDRMLGQKTREEQEERKKKELQERMLPEKTKERIRTLPEKRLACQEEKHQLLLQLKKKEFFHEEEKWRPEEQSTLTSALYQQSLTGTRPFTSSAWEDTMTPAPSRCLDPKYLFATQNHVGPAAAFVGTPELGQFQGPGSASGTAQPPPDSGPHNPPRVPWAAQHRTTVHRISWDMLGGRHFP